MLNIQMYALLSWHTVQVPALLLVTVAVVLWDPVKENLRTATVIVCATSLMTVALMQVHYVLDECSTIQWVYSYLCSMQRNVQVTGIHNVVVIIIQYLQCILHSVLSTDLYH